MQFTPGEWTFVIDDNGELKIEIPGGHTIYLGDMEGTCIECFANGHLMAASPLLYAALKDYTERYGVTELASQALAQADSQEP